MTSAFSPCAGQGSKIPNLLRCGSLLPDRKSVRKILPAMLALAALSQLSFSESFSIDAKRFCQIISADLSVIDGVFVQSYIGYMNQCLKNPMQAFILWLGRQ